MGNRGETRPLSEVDTLNRDPRRDPRQPNIDYNTRRRASGSWSRMWQSFLWERKRHVARPPVGNRQINPGNIWPAQNLSEKPRPPRGKFPALPSAGPSVDYQRQPGQNEAGQNLLPMTEDRNPDTKPLTVMNSGARLVEVLPVESRSSRNHRNSKSSTSEPVPIERQYDENPYVEEWAQQIHWHCGWPPFKGLSAYDSFLRHLHEAATYRPRLEAEMRDMNTKLSNLEEECNKCKRHAVDQETKARKANEILRSRTDAMQHEFRQKEQELQDTMQALIESNENKIAKLKSLQDVEISRLKGTHINDISRLEGMHTTQLLTAQEQAERKLADAKEEARYDREQLEQKKNEEIAIQAAEIQRLNLRMASYSTKSYTAIPDQDFSSSFGNLSRKIINLCSRVTRPNHAKIYKTLDPHDFMEREGDKARNWPKFVRNVCWNLLLEGFFRYPLGFGAFGNDGEGYETLLRDYQLFTGGIDTLGRTGKLPTNMEANIARAWRFDAILKSIASSQSKKGFQPHWGGIFEASVGRAARELMDALRALSSGKSPSITGLEGEVAGIASEAALLALRIGSQRAHLFLEICENGSDARRLGSGKFKCETAAQRPGGNLVVDLMLQPCLVRLGDGHVDWESQKVLAQGQFLPQR